MARRLHSVSILPLYGHPFGRCFKSYSPNPLRASGGEPRQIGDLGGNRRSRIGGSMATRAFTEAPPNRDRLTQSSLDHPAESWAPPLAPTVTLTPGDALRGVPLRQDALGPVTREELPYQSPGQSDLRETETSFEWRRKLIAGSTIIAALGMSALAYSFFPSGGEKPPTQAAEPAPAVQSPPAAPVQSALGMPDPARAPLAAAAWPDPPRSFSALPPPKPVEASPGLAPAAPTGNTAARRTVPASQNRDVLFLQRTGVNIRSTPSATGSVLGTAPKGTRFEVTNRDGDWVQVESGRVKGWINARFLAPNEPQ
jgi:Bacterial SH3 domain